MDEMTLLLVIALLLNCCGQTKNDNTTNVVAAEANSYEVPNFNADSAYSYIEHQVDFGPRVPNSTAHKACAQYLTDKLQQFGAKLYLQEAILTAYNGEKLQAFNIIGAFNPDQSPRILLFAHWDSRPYSDHDPDPNNHLKPVDGADDGASGVAVLLEIARQLNISKSTLGVDIIFFDAEDYGEPEFLKSYQQDTWCLGSQFWAKHPHVNNYTAKYGILLDMVGSRNATFFKEYTSVRYAAPLVEHVWNTARNLGYGKFFINQMGTGVVDDHLYVINGRNIPAIDIINYDPDSENGFSNHWHTQNDNMHNIDKNTLKAVGQTLLHVIHSD